MFGKYFTKRSICRAMIIATIGVTYYNYTHFCQIWSPKKSTIIKYFGNRKLPMTDEMATYLVTTKLFKNSVDKKDNKKRLLKSQFASIINKSSIIQTLPLDLQDYALCSSLFKHYGFRGLAGLVMSGAKFNTIIQNEPLFKAMDEKYNERVFITGLNTDENFSVNGSGEMYFSSRENVLLHLQPFGGLYYSSIRTVQVPDYAVVSIGIYGRPRASHLYLGERMDINDFISKKF